MKDSGLLMKETGKWRRVKLLRTLQMMNWTLTLFVLSETRKSQLDGGLYHSLLQNFYQA